MADRPRVGILTLSDKASRGEREDTAGPAIAKLLEPFPVEIAEKAIIPDEPEQIVAKLRAWAADGLALILTTGGTGLGPRDHTPEATRRVPGLAELMRASGREHTPMASLSRGVVGLAGTTLIINLPGSEKGARESLEAILSVLSHALDLIAGDTEH